MKIVFIGGFQFPYGDAVAARYRTLTVALTRRGHKVTVISQLPFEPRTEDRVESGGYGYQGVRYFSALSAATFQRSYLRSACNIMRAVRSSCVILQTLVDREGVDIIYFQGNFTFYAVPVMRVALRNRIPIINEVMDWFDSFSFFGGLSHPLAWDHEVSMRLINRRFNGLIVISTYLQDYYRRHGARPLLVPSLMAYPSIVPDAPPAKGVCFGYFGRPSQKDGIYDLIAALHALAAKGIDFRCTIAGDDGRAGNLIRVRAIVAGDPTLADRVSFLGKVPQNELPNIFKECNALLLSRPDGRFSRAGLPQKLSEYMAMGRAVIVSGVGDIPRYVRNGVDGFVVEPGDIAAFAKAMAKIAQKGDLGAEMGASAWKRGREVFDVESHLDSITGYLKKTVDLYNNTKK